MRKVCVISSGRADYGLLYWPMKEIQRETSLELQTIVTGMHLSPLFGMTVRNFSVDGFPVSYNVDMLLSADSSVGVTKSLGLGVIGFADAFQCLKPDIIILLGDRFEILAAAQAALIAKIPVAHLFGGDSTEGAYDESIRHSITKMSHLHFVSNTVSEARVIQMGEDPKHVYNVGATSLDGVQNRSYLTRKELFKAIGYIPQKKNLLVTFHPVTLGKISSKNQFEQVLMALDSFGDDVGLIFTRPNADTDGQALNSMLDDFLLTHENAKAFDALGNLYLNTIKHVDAVVGNSSSGIYEAPSFNIPTINIGERQKGRIQASSIINCKAEKTDISLSIQQALRTTNNKKTINPYGDGQASRKIIDIIKSIDDFSGLLQKHFYDAKSSYDA